VPTIWKARAQGSIPWTLFYFTGQL